MTNVSALLGGVVLAAFSATAAANDYRVGVVDYPAHVNVESKPPSGRVLEYVDKLLEKSGDKPIYVPLPLKRALEDLKRGVIDVLLTIEEPSADTHTLDRPLFKLVPGMCFRKDNFIPFLSASHRFKGLKVGFVSGVEVPPILKNSGAELIPLYGSDTLNRGLKMVSTKRTDAFYHPNPVFTYHASNPVSKEVACSYFYGLTTNIFVAINPKMSEEVRGKLQASFDAAENEQSYTEFFTEQLKVPE